MAEVLVFPQEAVLQALQPDEAIERVRDGFVEYAGNEWQMPPKTYLDASPNGDFRAMPAKGAGLAILKWVTSFPGNPEAGLPVVMGVICVSSVSDGEPLALVDVRSVTALRTGAVAAVAAQELAREDASSVGMIGCGLHGTWAARCLAAAEYGPGVCFDPDPEAAGQLAGELGWEVGSREDAASVGIVGCGLHGTWAARCLADAEYGPGVCFDPDPDAAGRLAGELGWEAGALDDALGCDIVTCVTPGAEPVIGAGDVRPGVHLNMLGADGPGKAEAEPEAVAGCELFCDEWEQASHGGELTGAVEAGLVGRGEVTELGYVLTGAAGGRSGPEAATLFDSTGLAIQDLAICLALLEAERDGRLRAHTVNL